MKSITITGTKDGMKQLVASVQLHDSVDTDSVKIDTSGFDDVETRKPEKAKKAKPGRVKNYDDVDFSGIENKKPSKKKGLFSE